MMEFMIKFFEADTLAHTLTLESGLENIRISADKIAGTDFLAKEPKRFEFQHPADEWINQYILADEAEITRMILKYTVKAYQDGVLMFTGIIDASFLEYNEREETVSFVCYDTIRLLSVFEDHKMLYALSAGYDPGQCMGYLLQSIRVATGFPVPAVWNTYTPASFQVSDLEVLKIEWKKLIEKTVDPRYVSSVEAHCGFCLVNDIVELRFIGISYNDTHNHGRIIVHIYAKKWKFYNKICPEEIQNDLDVESDVLDPDDVAQYIDTTLIHWNETIYESFQANGGIYTIDPLDIHNDLFPVSAPNTKTIRFTGNPIPERIYPSGFYDGKNEQVEKLKVLKIALLMHNLTINCDRQGTMHLHNLLYSAGSTYIIDQSIISEYKIKRVNSSPPSLDLLDGLMGQTDPLKDCLTKYYEEMLTAKWELNITFCTEGLNLLMYDVLVINGNRYIILSIKPDLEGFADVTAWRING